MRCKCETCLLSAKIKRLGLTKGQKKVVMEVWERMAVAEDDLAVADAMLDGEWPSTAGCSLVPKGFVEVVVKQDGKTKTRYIRKARRAKESG